MTEKKLINGVQVGVSRLDAVNHSSKERDSQNQTLNKSQISKDS